jgi:four helix bundle protein
MEIVVLTYQLANQLPVEERFGLRSQITRCAVSIPSNIAEGSAKNSKREYKNYLGMSLGSSHELETQLLIIERLKLGDVHLTDTLLKGVDEEQKMLHSFIKVIEQS